MWWCFGISSAELPDVVANHSMFPSADVLFRITICMFRHTLGAIRPFDTVTRQGMYV